MSKVKPTRRSKASAQAMGDRPGDESGDGPQPQYPDKMMEPEPGTGDLKPDPQIDLGELEYGGSAGDAEPEGDE